MPIHDWTRVRGGVCQTFHRDWCCQLTVRLNDELLPPDHYALLETSSREPVDGFTRPKNDEADVAEPVVLGEAVVDEWETVGRNLVVVRAEDGDKVIEVIRLPLRPTRPLREMSIHLRPGLRVSLPLEETYLSAYREVPPRWRRVIEGESSS